MKKWARVLPYFRAELPQITFAVLLLLLSVGANVLKPWPVAMIIDNLTGEDRRWLQGPLLRGYPESSTLGFLVLAIFGLHVASGLFSAGQNYFSIRAGLKGLSRIRNKLFAKMQKLSPAFYQRMSQGDLIYRATWDTYSIQTLFQQGFFKLLQSLVSLVVMVVVMWRLNRELTLVMLAVFPPLLVVMYFFGRAMNKRSSAAHQADSGVTSLVQQNITALPLVQSFTQERREEKRFADQVRVSLKHRTSQHGMEVVYWLSVAVLFGAGTALVTWRGAAGILAESLTVGELVIFLSYLSQLYEPLNQITHVGATVSDASAGLGRIYEVLDTHDEVKEKRPPQEAAGAGAIVFENVTFGYLKETPVLRDLSLTIQPKETIAIIGPSGAGKTTLLNMVPRFYDPMAGRVLLNGADLKDLSLASLRSQVAYVFQEPLLLPATVAENIGYGRPDASSEEIEQAARLANAHEFIRRLPQGYGTIVGEGAARLSQGEKQRLNIARAFLKNAPILLLDEPTSALDAESEAQVVESLIKLLEGRTTLMVAHRLSTIEQVDRIIVIEDGNVIESGSPEELRRSGGYFTRVTSRSFGKV